MGVVLAIALILYLLADTVSRGKLGAVMRGTTKGVARTGGRAVAGGARKSREQYAAYLRSDAAPLRKTRKTARKTARVIGKPVGRGARASWRGAREGITEELGKLRTAIEAARVETERARVAAQDPAQGVARGKLGHSFDVAPALDPDARASAQPADPETAVTGTAPRSEADLWQDPAPMRAADGSLVTACEVAASGAYGPGPTNSACAPAPAAQQEGTPTMTTTNAPPVHVDSVPAWIAACDQLAQLCQQVHEAGVELGISGQAQGGLHDAIDTLRTVARQVRTTYTPLVEAASAVPQGAEAVTVGKARAQ